jgi:hypothetical protein
MTDIKAGSGELRATIQITRKATGKVETFELVGTATPEQFAEIAGTVNQPEPKE